MRTRTTIAVSVCAALGIAANATADDLMPPFYRGFDNSIALEYVSGAPGDPQALLLLNNADVVDLTPGDENFFGGSDFPPAVAPFPVPDGFVYPFEVHNFIDELPLKLIQVQITYEDFTGTGVTPEVVVTDAFDPSGPVTSTGGLTLVEQTPVGFFAKYEFELRPNPDFELIDILVPFEVSINQVVIDTVSIPAPGSATLAACAGIVALRRRR